ncbi:hypothetical protein [Actinomadura sp. NEAU-AAG7]|uniref:hypothetical protein n=1 Tax=Actinomadura sp. NEAU-AAG7 TaxID=2839640 RepID=UPI001BE49726|nr:hypothetical protein [Actinomadura sp. NEAU-AAG7]MBT2207087.1 hypothetical protein [Actinomadura sp. NEAU-AAG7]
MRTALACSTVRRFFLGSGEGSGATTIEDPLRTDRRFTLPEVFLVVDNLPLTKMGTVALRR